MTHHATRTSLDQNLTPSALDHEARMTQAQISATTTKKRKTVHNRSTDSPPGTPHRASHRTVSTLPQPALPCTVWRLKRQSMRIVEACRRSCRAYSDWRRQQQAGRGCTVCGRRHVAVCCQQIHSSQHRGGHRRDSMVHMLSTGSHRAPLLLTPVLGSCRLPQASPHSLKGNTPSHDRATGAAKDGPPPPSGDSSARSG